MTSPDNPYSTVYTKDDEIHLSQFARGDNEEAYIWMDRTANELLECERDPVQRKVAELYDLDYDFSW